MNRLESLDFLRGLMLLIMMFNHLLFMGFSQWIGLTNISYGLFGYVTAAEGFYFLSGLICAIVFSKKAQQKPTEVLQKTRARTKEIYRWHLFTLAFAVGMILFFPAIRPLLEGNPFMTGLLQSPSRTLALGTFFLAMPPFLNILPLYMLYLYLTPFILSRLVRKQGWLIFALSIALWGLAQTHLWFNGFAYLKKAWPNLPFDGGYFDPLAWQLLFVSGLILGNLFVEGRLSTVLKKKGLIMGSALLCLGFWMHKNGLFHLPADLPQEWSNISQLGILRVMNFSVLVVCIGWLAVTWPKLFAFRPLIFLGQHSLYVFVYHVLFLYLTIGLKPWLVELPFALRLVVFGCCMLTLWIPARLHASYRSAQRMRLVEVQS